MEGVLIQGQSSTDERVSFVRWAKAILALCNTGNKPCLAFDCEGINLGFASGTLELMMLALVGTNCSMEMNASFEQRKEDESLFSKSFLIDLGREADIECVELVRSLFARPELHLCGWGLRNDIVALYGESRPCSGPEFGCLECPSLRYGADISNRCLPEPLRAVVVNAGCTTCPRRQAFRHEVQHGRHAALHFAGCPCSC